MGNQINEELLKALQSQDSSGDPTSEAEALINEIVERDLHVLVLRGTPILNRVSKKTWSTNAYVYRQQLSDPEGSFLYDGETMPSVVASTFDKVSVPMKYLYVPFSVTGPMQYAVRDWINLLDNELQSATASLSRIIERKLVTGDSSVRPKEFDGLDKQITTNVHDKDGELLVLNDLDVAIDSPMGMTPNTMVTNRAGARRINALLQAQQRFVDRVEVAAGFEVATYRGIPVMSLDNGAANDVAGKIIFFHNSLTNFVVQRPTFIKQLGVTRDSDDFFLGMYATFAVEDENWHTAKIVGADFTVGAAPSAGGGSGDAGGGSGDGGSTPEEE